MSNRELGGRVSADCSKVVVPQQQMHDRSVPFVAPPPQKLHVCTSVDLQVYEVYRYTVYEWQAT